MWIIFKFTYENTGLTVTICRKTYPALRASCMRDFFEILKTYDIYKEENHNKTNSEYLLNGNLIEFISLDQPQKLRGRKRDLLYINEANEMYFEDWQQLIFRTTGKVILDYNPSDEYHFIYDKIKPRDDCDFFITTYLDNPFLDESIISEIERLKDIDLNYWKIYGLGERGQSRSLIFSHNQIDTIPEEAKFKAFGLDFGYSNDVTSIVAVYELHGTLYLDELLYKTGMTNSDIGNYLKSLEIDRTNIIWCDSSEPKSIEELHRMGFNTRPVKKGPDSINIGIDIMRRHQLIATSRSLNLIKEFRNYKYIEDKNGNVLNKPVDAFNHAIDAVRYACMMTFSRPNVGKYSIR